MPAVAARPRLLVCTDTFPPQVNGVSVVTALSVEGLEARGWDVALVAPRYPQTSERVFPAADDAAATRPQLRLPSMPLPLYPDIRLSLPSSGAVARLADRHRPQLVHCATEFSIGSLGRRLAARRGVPLVTSYHTDFSRYTESYGVGWLRPAVSRHLTGFHACADRTYTPSTPSADDVRALGARDVEVWGRGVDTTLFHPRHRHLPLRLAYGPRGAFLFLHVGRLAAEKGVEHVLDAYARVRAHVPRDTVHLIVAGAGPRADALRARGTDGVTFLGNLDRETVLPRLYASADAFLFASVTETLGLVVLEAMASGLPVVATPAGGVADHLRDGENGLAFPARDTTALATQMLRLVRDRAMAQQLGDGARRTAEALDWRHELDRLDGSYREVIARHARALARAG